MAAVSQGSKVTKWWQCSCGERYAVGDCGKLNQAGRCTWFECEAREYHFYHSLSYSYTHIRRTLSYHYYSNITKYLTRASCSNTGTACGAVIGGQNKHGSTVPQGNTMVTNAGAITLPGYADSMESRKSLTSNLVVDELSPLTVLFFRFVLHSLLAVGALSSKSGATRLSCLLPTEPVTCQMRVILWPVSFRLFECMDQLNLSVVETASQHLCPVTTPHRWHIPYECWRERENVKQFLLRTQSKK